MGLQGGSIGTWEEMKNLFSDKYKEYCKAHEKRYGIFHMTQREDETLEGYVERFHFSYKHATNFKLEDESPKLVLLRGVREDLMEALDLIVTGDIHKFTYDEIKYIFKNYSRETTRNSKGC